MKTVLSVLALLFMLNASGGCLETGLFRLQSYVTPLRNGMSRITLKAIWAERGIDSMVIESYENFPVVQNVENPFFGVVSELDKLHTVVTPPNPGHNIGVYSIKIPHNGTIENVIVENTEVQAYQESVRAFNRNLKIWARSSARVAEIVKKSEIPQAASEAAVPAYSDLAPAVAESNLQAAVSEPVVTALTGNSGTSLETGLFRLRAYVTPLKNGMSRVTLKAVWTKPNIESMIIESANNFPAVPDVESPMTTLSHLDNLYTVVTPPGQNMGVYSVKMPPNGVIESVIVEDAEVKVYQASVRAFNRNFKSWARFSARVAEVVKKPELPSAAAQAAAPVYSDVSPVVVESGLQADASKPAVTALIKDAGFANKPRDVSKPAAVKIGNTALRTRQPDFHQGGFVAPGIIDAPRLRSAVDKLKEAAPDAAAMGTLAVGAYLTQKQMIEYSNAGRPDKAVGLGTSFTAAVMSAGPVATTCAPSVAGGWTYLGCVILGTTGISSTVDNLSGRFASWYLTHEKKFQPPIPENVKENIKHPIRAINRLLK
ncbi:MAG: hypothetical protein WCW52_05465 [Elusimicrobiales bacterium]|jgi:hypothetical protein